MLARIILFSLALLGATTSLAQDRELSFTPKPIDVGELLRFLQRAVPSPL